MKVVSALSYQCLAAAAAIQNVTQWLQLECLLMIFRPMYKGGCDIKSGKRCLYYSHDIIVCCILLVMYSWCNLAMGSKKKVQIIKSSLMKGSEAKWGIPQV